MSTFICEKCGRLDNTACGNNYWHAIINKYREEKCEKIIICFKPEFSYFENHVCCSDCCEGVAFYDNSGTLQKGNIDIKNKEHWTKFGKEKLLEWEAKNDGSMVNATEFFVNNKL